MHTAPKNKRWKSPLDGFVGSGIVVCIDSAVTQKLRGEFIRLAAWGHCVQRLHGLPADALHHITGYLMPQPVAFFRPTECLEDVPREAAYRVVLFNENKSRAFRKEWIAKVVYQLKCSESLQEWIKKMRMHQAYDHACISFFRSTSEVSPLLRSEMDKLILCSNK